jgi:Tol biopolymer transport system component
VLLLALIATMAVVAPNGTLSAVGPTMAHELGTGAQPAWSPDGLRLAFVRDGDVWTIDATGGNATRLTADGVNALPVWSPDGTRLAWLKDSTLVVGGADGVGLSTLAEGLSAAPAWSPDGTRLAFERRAGADAALMVVPAAGGAVTRLGFGASTVAPAWLGSTIAYVDDHRLFLWPGHRALAPKVSVSSAPDRSRSSIAFSGPGGIFVVTGTKVLALGKGAEPRFSHDGTRIAYTRLGALWQMNADGTCRRKVGAYAQPAWAPVAVGRLRC